MTIQLTKDTYVAGVLSAAGSQHTLDAQTESYLVHIGAATWVETAYTQGRFEDAKIEYDSDGVAVGVVGRGNEVVGPVWTTDDSGNVTGLVGPSGNAIPLHGTSCEAFGASPSSTSADNHAAIQAALDLGGLVTLTAPGVYPVNAPLTIGDETDLRVAAGVTIFRADGVNAPLIRNAHEAYRLNAADLSRTASATVVVNDRHHDHAVGDKVIVLDCPTAAYNGVQTVSAVTDHTWSYLSGGSATDTGGGATYYAAIIPVRDTIAAANVSASGGYVTVTDVNSVLRPGDNIYVYSTDAATDAAFVGERTVVRVTPGVDYVYYSAGASGTPTGSLLMTYTVGITLSGGGTLDGNLANQAAPGTGATLGQRVNTVNVSMVSRFTVKDQSRMVGAVYRGINLFNCAQVDLDVYVEDCLVGVQFEGACRDVIVRKMRGESVFLNATYGKYQSDDFIAFTGTKYLGNAGYDNVTSPFPLGNFDFDLWDIHAENCKNGVKITAYSDCHISGRVRRLTGGAKNPVLINGAGTTVGVSAGVQIMDDAVGGGSLVGGHIDRLDIDYVDFHDAYASAAFAAVSISNTGTNGQITIGYIDDGLDVGALVYYSQSSGSTDLIKITGQRATSDMPVNTKPRYLFNAGTLKTLDIGDSYIITNTTATGSVIISVKSGCTISSFSLHDTQYGGPSAYNGTIISCGGTITKTVFRNLRPTASAHGVASIFLYTKPASGNFAVHLIDSEIKANSYFTDAGFNIGTPTISHYLSGAIWSPGGNNFIQCIGSAQNHYLYGGLNNSLESQIYITGSGSQVINMFCERIKIDVTNSARLGKAVGAVCWNTNAALGTLGAAGPVRCDGTNWRLMSDTTKYY